MTVGQSEVLKKKKKKQRRFLEYAMIGRALFRSLVFSDACFYGLADAQDYGICGTVSLFLDNVLSAQQEFCRLTNYPSGYRLASDQA